MDSLTKEKIKIFVVAICFFVGIALLLGRACSDIKQLSRVTHEVGLKNIINELWEGKANE